MGVGGGGGSYNSDVPKGGVTTDKVRHFHILIFLHEISI